MGSEMCIRDSYKTVCVPRQQRRLQRFLNQNLHEGPPKQTRAGGPDPPGDGRQPQQAGSSGVGTTEVKTTETEKVGAAAKRKARREARAEQRKSGRAYPAGKQLSVTESGRSIKHAPRDKSGKVICWDASCWSGCPKTAATCAHSHEVIKGMGGLDWTVQAQLIRRGGLKSGAKVDPASVDGRIAQLRTQAKTEADGKRAGGAGKPGETSQTAQPAGARPQGGRCSGLSLIHI